MSTRNLFISNSGELLPRWLEAFPKAKSCSAEEISKQKTCDIVWLRTQKNSPLAQLLDEIRQRLGSVPCVVLADNPNDEEALAAFGAAARGYCNTHADAAVLKQIASVVEQGGLWIGESLMQRVITSTARVMPRQQTNQEWAETLTEREREIARAIARGASNKEIAREFGITERTVKAHVSSILEKIKVRDRLQIALRVNN